MLDHDRTIEGVVTHVVVHHVGSSQDLYHVHLVDHLGGDHLNNQGTILVEGNLEVIPSYTTFSSHFTKVIFTSTYVTD